METPVCVWEDDLSGGIWPRSGPVWLIAFWIALLIIRPWERLLPSLEPLHVERIFAILASSVVVGCGLFRFCSSFQTTGILLWFLALVLSFALAISPSLAWDGLYVYFTLFVFYFVILSVTRTPYQLVFIVACFLVAMGLYLGKSEWEYFFCGGRAYSMGVPRLQGIDTTYSHPNSVATSTVLSLPFLYFLWKVRNQFTRTWPQYWRTRFTYALLLYFAIAVSAIVLTNSRTGLLAFFVFVLLCALARGNVGGILAGLAVGRSLARGSLGRHARRQQGPISQYMGSRVRTRCP